MAPARSGSTITTNRFVLVEVKYTIKDGIIYDAKKLLSDVKQLVDDEKKKAGFVLKQPGQ